MTNEKTTDSAASALSAGLGVLLPCPFCGVATTVELTDSDTFNCALPFESDGDSNPMYWAVFCDASKPAGKGGCGASGGFAPTKEDAIKRWNTRTPNAKLTGVPPTDATKGD